MVKTKTTPSAMDAGSDRQSDSDGSDRSAASSSTSASSHSSSSSGGSAPPQTSMILTRTVRPNRGQLLKQMIAQGFASSDEEVLKAASSSDDEWSRTTAKKKKKGEGQRRSIRPRDGSMEPESSSSASSSSSSSASYSDDDDTDSDFSEEEMVGKLSDATSESEDERQAARRLRKEAREDAARDRKGVVFSRKGSAQPLEHKVTLVRRAPTLPWESRMNDALARAEQIIAEHPESTAGAATTTQSLLASLKRPTRKRPRRHVAGESSDQLGVDKGAPRAIWSSSKALLDATGSHVVITFPDGRLPLMFQCS